MSLRTRFIISNIFMLITPIIVCGVISVFFLVFFIMLFPSAALELSAYGFSDMPQMLEYLSKMFAVSPFSALYVSLWIISCVGATALILTHISERLARSIIPPLSRLTDAVEHIKSGDLDFEITGSSNREIDYLGKMLDEMRVQLKRSRAREEILRSERGMILANLSHDIKTPITAIKGYVRGLEDGMIDHAELRGRYLETIYNKSDVIEKMIDSLSIYSMLDMDKIQFSYTVGDIYEYVRNIAQDFELDAQRAGCRLTVDLPQTKCYVKIDYKMLYRVFANLIDNSIKYRSDSDCYIHISAKEHDDGVLISILDNGIGMADEELTKIFDGFYRIDSSRSKKGSGLGLGIARRIVSRHDGRLWFKSGLKTGSEAIIYLPKRHKLQKGAADHSNG